MNYSNSPIRFELDDNRDLIIARSVTNTIEALDHWVNTIVFTSIRRFKADEDFGFSFWDNEYIAMNLIDFNNGSDYKVVRDKRDGRESKQQLSLAGIQQCERSVRDSIAFYFPVLKNISVDVQLSMETSEFSPRAKGSKYVVRVLVKGRLAPEVAPPGKEDYQCPVEFFMDPFFNSRR